MGADRYRYLSAPDPHFAFVYNRQTDIDRLLEAIR